ncbi:unnamed protein product [Alopecurus aequalis]
MQNSGKQVSSAGVMAQGGEEGVDSMLGCLNLLADVTEVVEMSDDEEDHVAVPVRWSLFGKVLSPLVTHSQTIQAAMRPVWGNPTGLKIRTVVDNVFVADFANLADRDRAREGAPWMVKRHAVILHDYDPRLRPSDVKFDFMQIWVRILNLPFEWMNDTKGLKIAKLINKHCKVDVDDSGEASGSFLRARVAIPIDQPLQRWVTVKRGSEELRFDLQYEKLPFYCFSCGLTGHGELECKTPTDRDGAGKLPFDRNLWAPEERRKKLQSFGQAATSASCNSDSAERGSGRTNCFIASASSRTSCDPREDAVTNLHDQEVSSPPTKSNAPELARARGSDTPRNLFSAVVPSETKQLRKRKLYSGLGSKGGSGAKGKDKNPISLGLDLALVVPGKGSICFTDPGATVTEWNESIDGIDQESGYGGM